MLCFHSKNDNIFFIIPYECLSINLLYITNNELAINKQCIITEIIQGGKCSPAFLSFFFP